MAFIRSFKIGDDEVRVKVLPYREYCLIDIRIYEREISTGRMVSTHNGIVLPAQFFPELMDSLKSAEDYIVQKGVLFREKLPLKEKFLYYCSECGEPLVEVEEGIYECKCKESRIVQLPTTKAVEKLYAELKDKKFHEEFSAG